MKKVLVSLLVGVTLCGGLLGCGESAKDRLNSTYKYSEDNSVEERKSFEEDYAELQPYRYATTYVKQEMNKSGHDFVVTLNEYTKTINISYDTGDTSVSDLRNQGFDDEIILSIAKWEEMYSNDQILATTIYSEVVNIYGISDVKVKTEIKIGGETVCIFNQDGECEYSIFWDIKN